MLIGEYHFLKYISHIIINGVPAGGNNKKKEQKKMFSSEIKTKNSRKGLGGGAKMAEE